MIREFRSISEVNGPLVFSFSLTEKYVMVKYWRPLIVFLWSKFLKGPRV